jgi:hypothetical protein
MSNVLKAIVATIGACAVTIEAVISDGRITGIEGWTIVIAFVSAALVYFVPNVVSAMYAKFIQAAVGAGVMALTVAVNADGNVSTDDWVKIGVAVATAIGVYLFPNSKPVGPVVTGPPAI